MALGVSRVAGAGGAALLFGATWAAGQRGRRRTTARGIDRSELLLTRRTRLYN